MRRLAILAFPLMLACGVGSPSRPTATPTASDEAKPAEVATPEHAPGTVNALPNLVIKTTPRAIPGDPWPEITGPAPLTVRFNLCESTDPDQDAEDPAERDSLNWQFHFGDSGEEAFREDGTFRADFEHFCRTEHTYAEGTHTATLSVTDKHLEDQSREVTALARATQRITIVATGEGASTPRSPGCQALNGTTGTIPLSSVLQPGTLTFRAGEVLTARFTLNTATVATVGLYLSTTPLGTPTFSSGVATVSYTVPSDGSYFFQLFNFATSDGSVDYSLTCL